jgi:hypothetical protein
MDFLVSQIPNNPLGEGQYIRTAAALIIGYVCACSGEACTAKAMAKYRDEILNGNTLDRNSNYFARFCFENGIEL